MHLQLAFLAPRIQQAIIEGAQPAALTLHRLTRPEMPADWYAQYRRTGIAPRSCTGLTPIFAELF